MQFGAWLTAFSAPVAEVPEVGKAAGDKRGESGWPECGKYMESDEEMEHEDAKTKERWDLEKEEAGKPSACCHPYKVQ